MVSGQTRLDSKDRKLILDYKTTSQTANPIDLARIFVSMGYDIQNAFYTLGVKAVEGSTRNSFSSSRKWRNPTSVPSSPSRLICKLRNLKGGVWHLPLARMPVERGMARVSKACFVARHATLGDSGLGKESDGDRGIRQVTTK